MVNGEKISGPTTLRVGDVVTVQGIKLEVVEAAAPGGGKTLVLSGTTFMELGSDTWSLIQVLRKDR